MHKTARNLREGDVFVNPDDHQHYVVTDLPVVLHRPPFADGLSVPATRDDGPSFRVRLWADEEVQVEGFPGEFDGYCPHGVFVAGGGRDIPCATCEMEASA